MAIPDEQVAREALAKNGRGQTLRAAVLDAWQAVSMVSKQYPWWRRKGTAAALMWEQSVQNAAEALANDDCVKVIPHYDTTSFIIEDKILLRMKKANIQLFTSNYPTQLAENFHNHDEDLFGFVGLGRVELCHILNRFKTKVDWVGVVARDAGKIHWHIDLDLTEAKVIPLPLPKSGSAADTVLKPILPGKKDSTDGVA